MHRLLPPQLFLLSLIAMLCLHRWLPMQHWLPSDRIAPGLLVVLGGAGITLWHALLFKRLNTNIKTFNPPDQLVTAGLFRFTRNPMYLGFSLALLGCALLLGSASPFLVVLAFVMITDRWYIPFEERAMAARFGQDYQHYCNRVRRWL